MKKFHFLVPFFLITTIAFAQNNSVTGSLTDVNDKSPLIGASVILLNSTDSSIYKGATADVEGQFIIPNVAKGKYVLKISYLGYADLYKKAEMLDTPLSLGNIALKQSSKMLKDIVVEGKAPTAVQKGDTTQYNANSYKTNPDANAEDLVTKMAGITSQDGKVQAHGEDVKRVLVDGKPFFGDDVNAVLKNLPAEVIDKIQVFDQLSDQSKFTGINDGNTTKTINILTKPGMKNGTFGKIYAGYGYEDVYKAGANINFFKDDRRISIIAQTNNINEQNFSADDLAGVVSSSGGGGRQRGSRGGGGGNNSSNFLVNAKNGVATTHAVGINYTDKWGKKVDITGSYFFNRSDNKLSQLTNRQYVLQSDSGQVYNENNITNSKNINHRANVRLEWKIDTSNSITFTPKFSLQQNDGTSNLIGKTKLIDTLLNETSNNYKSNEQAYTISSDLLLQHKFKKRGQTFSVTLSGGQNSTNANSNFYAANNYYNDTSFLANVLDQKSDLAKIGTNLGSNFVYTEPISLKSVVTVSYANSFNFTQNDKQTFNYSSIDDSYNHLDTALSNKFKSEYITHRPGLGYRFNNMKVQFIANINYQFATLTSDEVFPTTYSLNKHFENVLPFAMLRYSFNFQKNVRIFYRTQTTQPSIDQLQNVVNNSNPLQLSVGNPQLKQSYQHSVFVRYSSTNTEKGTSLFVMVAGSINDDYITNSTYTANRDVVKDGILLQRGSQLTQPINMNGYVNLRSFITYGVPVSFIKSNLNVNLNAAYIKTPGLINDQTNFSNSQTYGLGLTLSSNISKQVDFTISSTSNYNIVDNTLNKQLNSTYLNQTSRLKLNLIFLKNVVLGTDLTHQYYSGLSAGYNQNFLLWNAGLGYKILKDQKAEIRFSVYDILKQNINITRNITETYTEDIQTNLLQRYFMLTLTYNIKVFKKPDEKSIPK